MIIKSYECLVRCSIITLYYQCLSFTTVDAWAPAFFDCRGGNIRYRIFRASLIPLEPVVTTLTLSRSCDNQLCVQLRHHWNTILKWPISSILTGSRGFSGGEIISLLIFRPRPLIYLNSSLASEFEMKLEARTYTYVFGSVGDSEAIVGRFIAPLLLLCHSPPSCKH